MSVCGNKGDKLTKFWKKLRDKNLPQFLVCQAVNNQIKKDEILKVWVWGNLKRINNCGRNKKVMDSLGDINVDAE
jgi:hypothetical protein